MAWYVHMSKWPRKIFHTLAVASQGLLVIVLFYGHCSKLEPFINFTWLSQICNYQEKLEKSRLNKLRQFVQIWISLTHTGHTVDTQWQKRNMVHCNDWWAWGKVPGGRYQGKGRREVKAADKFANNPQWWSTWLPVPSAPASMWGAPYGRPLASRSRGNFAQNTFSHITVTIT